MPSLPRTTSREEMNAIAEGAGPLGGERLTEYNIFLSDQFGNSKIQFLEGPGVPAEIDGFENDDSYRRSRFLARRSVAGAFNNDNLRENSLARQLDSKEDRSATIRLIRRRASGELERKDASEPQAPWVNIIPPNTKFFLETAQESREEKVQVIDTFGEWMAFFFGKRPEVYTYAGTLLNAKNHNWKSEFLENYDYFLRGTQAVKNRATVFLQYDDVVVEGYIMNCSIGQSSDMDNGVSFQFNLLVINRSPVDPRRLLELRINRSGGTEDEIALFNSMQDALDLTQEGRLDDLDTFFIMREYFSGNYVPPAGNMTTRPGKGTVDSDSRSAPGQKSGLKNQNPGRSSFESVLKRKIDDSNSSLQGAGASDLTGIGNVA